MRNSNVRKRRSTLEVRLEILGVIHNGETKPTRIMYAPNMTYAQVKQEFEQLLEGDIIVVTDAEDEYSGRKGEKRSKICYYLTSKGTNVLRYLKNKASGLEKLMEVMYVGMQRN